MRMGERRASTREWLRPTLAAGLALAIAGLLWALRRSPAADATDTANAPRKQPSSSVSAPPSNPRVDLPPPAPQPAQRTIPIPRPSPLPADDHAKDEPPAGVLATRTMEHDFVELTFEDVKVEVEDILQDEVIPAAEACVERSVTPWALSRATSRADGRRCVARRPRVHPGRHRAN